MMDYPRTSEGIIWDMRCDARDLKLAQEAILMEIEKIKNVLEKSSLQLPDNW